MEIGLAVLVACILRNVLGTCVVEVEILAFKTMGPAL